MDKYDRRSLKQKVSISLDEDIIEIVKDCAQKDSRNFSQYINYVLRCHINELKNSEAQNNKN